MTHSSENNNDEEKILTTLKEYNFLKSRNDRYIKILNKLFIDIDKMIEEKLCDLDIDRIKSIERSIKSKNKMLLLLNLQISYTLIKELYEKYLCIFKISEIEDIIIKKALLHIRENIYFNAVEIQRCRK